MSKKSKMDTIGNKNILWMTFIILLLVLVLLGVVIGLLLGNNPLKKQNANSDNHQENLGGTSEVKHASVGDLKNPVAETHKNIYDFGKLKKTDGAVTTTFEIENHGKQPLTIGKITTSCRCTSAEVDKKKLEFNETAILTVTFDPNIHEEPAGSFKRTIYVETNDPQTPELVFDIYQEIVGP